MKKRNIIIVVVALLSVYIFVFGGIMYQNHLQAQKEKRNKNVFDQMYYTRVHKTFDWFAPGNFKGDFVNMKQLEGTARDEELSYTRMGLFREYYRSKYLEKGTELGFDFHSGEEKKIIIAYYTNLNETDEKKKYDDYKWYCYTYSVDNKTLTYTTNDPENKHKDFIYTIFLKDWFEANPNTIFSMDNLGEFTVVEGE